MGNRAVKNRMRHGFKTTMYGSGPTGRYTTERPPYVHSQYRDSQRHRPQPNVETGYVNPRRTSWEPRHITDESSDASKARAVGVALTYRKQQTEEVVNG